MTSCISLLKNNHIKDWSDVIRVINEKDIQEIF